MIPLDLAPGTRVVWLTSTTTWAARRGSTAIFQDNSNAQDCIRVVWERDKLSNEQIDGSYPRLHFALTTDPEGMEALRKVGKEHLIPEIPDTRSDLDIRFEGLLD